MLIKSILFDLDDTLHNRKVTLSKYIDNFIKTFSTSLNEPELNKVKELFIRIDNKGYKPRKELFLELLNAFSWSKTPDIEEFMEHWNSSFPMFSEPMKDLYKVLDFFLRNKIKIGIITNGDTDFQNRKIEKLNIRKYLDIIIISEDYKIRKPNIEIFNIALTKINSKKEETLYVGDNPSTDIKGAYNSGIKSVWISEGAEWNIDEYTPDYSIARLAELLNLLDFK